ncbi:MAG TPA: hypothetical protein PLN56_05860 [Methanoregulaceae archaeon]|nr:MAG: hypothetical protein IPI71_06725 [Methanolinea sp.]HON81692.1 hypothetical protein [Methanoregulaceae archaeon]HPD10502.1 hypothetical protein [Methanoregulaceae archaeon]HRT15520.1 hypothetical protein [Methanoregulaceae archaeon]HRU31090.1 hypothetical protein [Methanoregulaceae archaeon]
MEDITSWLKKNLSSFHPDERMALSATRHLTGLERSRLFSPEIEKMRTAEGRWYEALIYEMFRSMASETDGIRQLALKGMDVPRQARQKIRLGQNGLFYSRCGDITVRGNGQDLAEFDLLFIDCHDQVAFAEVVTSASDMKEFEKEIAYKRRLLGYLFDQEDVSFLLVSSFDVTNYVVGRRLLKTPKTVYIQTSSCEELKSCLHRDRQKVRFQRQPPHKRLVLAPEIQLRKEFCYETYHEEERARVFDRVSSPDGGLPDITNGTGQLVKKILYGGLYPSAIRSMCRDHRFLFQGREIKYYEIMNLYSKAILATDLPGYDAIVYLRPRRKQEYLKMVQNGDGNFKFERFTPARVGFYLWLESISPSLGARITRNLVDAFSPDGSKKCGGNDPYRISVGQDGQRFASQMRP